MLHVSKVHTLHVILCCFLNEVLKYDISSKHHTVAGKALWHQRGTLENQQAV